MLFKEFSSKRVWWKSPKHDCLVRVKSERSFQTWEYAKQNELQKCSLLTSICCTRYCRLESLWLFYEKTHNHNAYWGSCLHIAIRLSPKKAPHPFAKDNFLECDYKARDKALPISLAIQLVSVTLSLQMGQGNFRRFF